MITKVNENLYRGPRPTMETMDELQRLDVKTLIDLESGAFEFLHNDNYKKFDFAAHGMKEYDVSCSDITPPTADHVDAALQIIAKGEPTYVHCLHGNDRTGFVMAVYRMKIQKWSFKDAVKEMFSLGFHKIPYIWWLINLKKYEVKK